MLPSGPSVLDNKATAEKGSDSKAKAVHQVLNEFANSTSLNGIPRIINARSMSGRMSWAVICLGAFAMFVWTSSNLVANYYAYPKKVNVEIVQRPVTFPSVTVCNTDHLDLLVVEQLEQIFTENATEPEDEGQGEGQGERKGVGEGEGEEEEGGGAGERRQQQTNTRVDEFLRRYEQFATYSTYYLHQKHDAAGENQSFPGAGRQNLDMGLLEVTSRLGLAANVGPELSSEAGIRAKDFIITCRFMGDACDIERTFVRVFDPYYFNCFTFKTQVMLESRSTRLSGVEYGLSLLLFSGTAGHLNAGAVNEIVPGMQSSDPALASGQGARVVIHSPDTMPHPTVDGFDVPSGFSVTIGVRARENVRIPHPYGNCTEVETNGPFRYSLISCQNQCIQTAIERTCRCIDNRIPTPDNRPAHNPLPFCLQFPATFDRCSMMTHHQLDSAEETETEAEVASVEENGEEACRASVSEFSRRLDCRKMVYENMTIRNPDAMDQCRCFPPCLDVVYDASYSLSMLPEDNKEHAAFYARVDEFLHRLNPRRRKKLPSKLTNETQYLTAVKRLMSRLNVHIADNNILKATESPDYDLIRLVSDIGGQLGLWIGISVITLMEVMQLCADIMRAVMSCYGTMRLMAGRGATISDLMRVAAPGEQKRRQAADDDHVTPCNHLQRRMIEETEETEEETEEGAFSCEIDRMKAVDKMTSV